MPVPHRAAARLGAALSVAALAACGSPGESTGDSQGPVRVGIIYSESGPLATYGQQYYEGFQAGLDHATDGTGEVDGRPVEVTTADSAGEPERATAEAQDLIADGHTILAGATSSGVASQLAPLAEQNETLFISGPAATDTITGVNDYTFRSGRQTYQDIQTAASALDGVEGSTVAVLAQQNAFGQDNLAAVEQVLGGEGAEVVGVLAPPDATDLTPFADRINSEEPDLLFVAWAGETAAAMWQALEEQQVFDTTTVITGLDIRATYPVFGSAGQDIDFLSHYFAGASDTAEAQAMAEGVADIGGEVDLFTPDGFTAAQMVVRAIEGGDSAQDRIEALEGWTFPGVKGELTVRAEDHALIQPMYRARLVGEGEDAEAELVEELDAADVAPPVASGGGDGQ